MMKHVFLIAIILGVLASVQAHFYFQRNCNNATNYAEKCESKKCCIAGDSCVNHRIIWWLPHKCIRIRRPTNTTERTTTTQSTTASQATTLSSSPSETTTGASSPTGTTAAR